MATSLQCLQIGIQILNFIVLVYADSIGEVVKKFAWASKGVHITSPHGSYIPIAAKIASGAKFGGSAVVNVKKIAATALAPDGRLGVVEGHIVPAHGIQ